MVKVTINCDMGEAFGIYRFGDDEACMPFITHANVACGFHASDPAVMRETVRAAKRHGVAIGAHPGLPDREGFGRREMKLSRDEVSALVLYALPHQECYRRTDRQEWGGDTESDRCRRWQDGSAWVRGARSRRRW